MIRSYIVDQMDYQVVLIYYESNISLYYYKWKVEVKVKELIVINKRYNVKLILETSLQIMVHLI